MMKGNMKNKKIIIGCLIAVVILIIGVIVGLSLKGNGSSDDELGSSESQEEHGSQEMYEIQGAQDTLTGMIERKLLINELAARDEDRPDYLEEMESRSSYQVLSIESGDTSYAVVKVTAPDLYSTVHKLEMTEGMTEEEMDRVLTQAIADAPLIETEVKLVCEYNDGWNLVLNRDFYDAYYGGVLRLRTEYFEQIVEEMKNEN